MKKIVIAGASLNSGNRGVNALTRSQIVMLLDRFGLDIDIKILSYTCSKENLFMYRGNEIKISEILCSKKNMMISYLKSFFNIKSRINDIISEADVVLDISEGDSFSDIYGKMRFFQHSFIKLITNNLGKKLIIMPQTLGPFNSSIVKFFAKKIIQKASNVFVRDTLSKDIIKDKLKVKRTVEVYPDMAFYMEPVEYINKEKFFESETSIKVGINVSALLYNEGYNNDNMFGLRADYKKLIDKLIRKFLIEENVEVILIPHVMISDMPVEDDFHICKKIADEINASNNKINVKTIDKYYREDEIKAIISYCDFFIGSRMHACIAAASTYVPVVPISYSRKFIGVWDELNMGYCVIDPKVKEEDEIMHDIFDLYESREKIKEDLIESIPKLKSKIFSISEYI